MAMAAVYTTVNGMILSETRGGTETIYVPDTLGSLVECRDSSGTKTYSAEYWPYGEVQTSTGSNPSPWGFVGLLGYLLDSANLLYVRARHYRPGYARWQTVDTVWPDQHAFGYVGSDPINYSDWSGLDRGDDILFDACLAALCSFKDTFDKVKSIASILGLSEKEVAEILKETAKDYAKDKAKEVCHIDPGNTYECLEDARKNPPSSLIGRSIRKLCRKMVKDSGATCAGTTTNIDDCYSCCERYRERNHADSSWWYYRRCMRRCDEADARR